MKINTDNLPDFKDMPSSESPDAKNHMDSQGNLLDGGILLKPLAMGMDDLSSNVRSDQEDDDLKTRKIVKTPPKDSTGGSGQQNLLKTRKDRFGNKISRGKKHKVTFKDQVGKGKVAKVFLVESYKKYNVESTNST